MDYYRNSVTRKSWEFLQELKRKYRFVVIGGWAVWLYAWQLKSKDIDLVIDAAELAKLRAEYQVVKNDRLNKYEMRQDEVEVDIYTPFYSNPGVPAEEILADGRVKEGFLVPSPEMLLGLKAVAWEARRASPKGRKDLIDIVCLLALDQLNQRKIDKIFSSETMKTVRHRLADELKSLTEVREVNLNRHQTAPAKKKWLAILG